MRTEIAADEIALRHVPPARMARGGAFHIRPLDALAFILDVKARLGIKEEMLPIYLDEISSTLYGAAYKAVKD
ncbi:IucA/IucC family siderophore biosynthesis protein, partial [Paraburkholderia sp. BR10937]